ncbi:hypothetical protein L7F22_016860 [Adiantum nelumboides]|nr:hypothetical protein [Adiantum nelumboides]
MMIAGTRWQEGPWRASPLPGLGYLPCCPPCSRVPSLGPHSPFLHCASLTSTELAAAAPSPKQCSAQLKESPSPPLSSEVLTFRNGGSLLQPISVSIPLGNRQITIETGLIGRQASGAATVTDGETILYATACASEEVIEPSDFAPLSVHYQERFSAAGRTSGGFFKREGRAKDHEVSVPNN